MTVVVGGFALSCGRLRLIPATPEYVPAPEQIERAISILAPA